MPEVTLTAEQRAALRQSKVIEAYKKVFGSDERSRTEWQRIVWEDLQIAGYSKQPVTVPGRDGQVCPYKVVYADGRRSLFLYVEANVTFTPPHEDPQQQPKRRRRTTTDASE